MLGFSECKKYMAIYCTYTLYTHNTLLFNNMLIELQEAGRVCLNTKVNDVLNKWVWNCSPSFSNTVIKSWSVTFFASSLHFLSFFIAWMKNNSPFSVISFDNWIKTFMVPRRWFLLTLVSTCIVSWSTHSYLISVFYVDKYDGFIRTHIWNGWRLSDAEVVIHGHSVRKLVVEPQRMYH